MKCIQEKEIKKMLYITEFKWCLPKFEKLWACMMGDGMSPCLGMKTIWYKDCDKFEKWKCSVRDKGFKGNW